MIARFRPLDYSLGNSRPESFTTQLLLWLSIWSIPGNQAEWFRRDDTGAPAGAGSLAAHLVASMMAWCRRLGLCTVEFASSELREVATPVNQYLIQTRSRAEGFRKDDTRTNSDTFGCAGHHS
ncbi:hypothetical protein FIBSPDRAFT_265871 [Athelia psychrophila]|uniref:Uncharacterized protein n=1 Tax=Athelia psychrophila TaxID=1759441 RepID=A0A165X843_9AGAM|nr:hypothetical protein FIBSPDRAFT_265871 [Fibularhizoctonia sp. CBS 109695]